MHLTFSMDLNSSLKILRKSFVLVILGKLANERFFNCVSYVFHLRVKNFSSLKHLITVAYMVDIHLRGFNEHKKKQFYNKNNFSDLMEMSFFTLFI